MNYTLIKICIGILISFGLQNTALSQINRVDDQGRKQGKWVKTFDDSEAIRYKGQFKNDQPIGKFVYYYPNNTVRSIIIHDENSNRSEAYFYHTTEDLLAHGIYRNQKKDSVWTHFLPTGHYSFIETYDNGELNGERITYYGVDANEDPKVKLILKKALYKNGEQHGEYIEYFPDGIIKGKGKYKHGYPDGVILKNHPNGKTMIKERWKNKKKHGWWTTYDESGKELGRKYYREGVELSGKELDAYIQELKEKGINPNK